MTDEQILRSGGWLLECQSPLEISKPNGSFASGEAARIVIDVLREAGDDYNQALELWMARKFVRAITLFRVMDAPFVAAAALDILDRQGRDFAGFFAELLLSIDQRDTIQNWPDGVGPEDLR